MVFEFRAVNMMFQDLRHHLLRKFVSFSHFCVEAVLAVLTVLSNSKRKAKMKVVGDMRCCLFWSLCNSFQIVIQTISIKSYYKVKMVDKLEYLDFCLIKCQILSIDKLFWMQRLLWQIGLIPFVLVSGFSAQICKYHQLEAL